MRTDHQKLILRLSLILVISSVISCSGRPGNITKPVKDTAVSGKTDLSAIMIKMTSPDENAEFRIKDQVKVAVMPDTETSELDSVRIIFDGKPVMVITSAPWEGNINSSFTSLTGRKSVKAVAYSKDKTQSVTRFVIIYSDIAPKTYGCKVIHTYPHDSEAFTQGLFYDSGFLYEGTGQETGSSLREVELQTGKVLRQHNLESSLFGEGITLYKDRIYQVTWTSKVGFVYNKSDFRQINRIYYQTEGWGLTTINDRIVMSDGSNILYFCEPEMFNPVSRLEVYDNRKKVDQLNELEYIDGEIWANLWQTDLIARIDPETGRVNSYVDLSSLFPASKRNETNADVLNGIAYDPSGKRIFVTGKKWPSLYEIKVTE
jgi:glutamine cyclotransferase